MSNSIRDRLMRDRSINNINTICEFPRNMLLEPTNICNHSCLICANSKGTKKKGVINPVFAKNILKQAYDLGTREVGFYGMGEPLVDKNLESYVEYAKFIGYEYVYITTNGALMIKERANALVNAGVDSIKFSINASNAEDYRFIHGKDDFDKVIENLIYLDSLRKASKRKIGIYISYIATRYTVSDEDKFRVKYQKYVDDIIFVNCRAAGDMIDEIGKHLSVNQDSEDAFSFKDNICPMVFNKLHVTYEGYLSMCCDDLQNYLAVADLNKESLEKAWNNKYARSLRKRHLEHNLKGTRCFNCIFNRNEPIEPLNSDLAVFYNMEDWNKESEIKDRIHRLKQNI